MIACLNGGGTVPDSRESLIMSVTIGSKQSRFFTRRSVGMGSRAHAFLGDDKTISFTIWIWRGS